MILTDNLVGDAGLYLRLSKDDGDKIESDSIQNQRRIIENFVKKYPGLKIRKEYSDDGWSGTNFERPRFQEMLSDMQSKKINCVIVKDLSRLGRNYIEMGKYIERVFPALNIRLIAINDNYDSADKNSDDTEIIIPFKNLLNDSYCRDISIKIRSNLNVKRKDGQFIGSFATYGYKKDPENKNHLIIDEYAAGIVEQIFDMRLNGKSPERIAEKLNEMKIRPPYEYKRKCGMKFDSGFRSGDNADWKVESVLRILDNEMYTGTMVQGKTRKINYKLKQRTTLSENEWVKVKETHEAIIPIEKYRLVQKLKELDTRVAPEQSSVYPLCGYIRCGTCGQNMIRRTTHNNGKKYTYYHCSTYKNGNGCSSHIINAEKIEAAVLDSIQKQLEVFDRIETLLQNIEQKPEERACVRNVRMQKEKLIKDLEYYASLLEKMYRDMVDGLIERDEYIELKKRFGQSRKQVEAEYAKIIEKEKRILEGQIDYPFWIESLRKQGKITTLSRSVVISAIDYISVLDGKEIEVHFMFQDQIQELLELAEADTCKEGEAI